MTKGQTDSTHSSFLLLALLLAACGSTMQISDRWMSAQLVSYKSSVEPFSSVAERFDTIWVDGVPQDIRAPNPFAPTMDISFFVADRDSVSIGKVRWTKKLFLGK